MKLLHFTPLFLVMLSLTVAIASNRSQLIMDIFFSLVQSFFEINYNQRFKIYCLRLHMFGIKEKLTCAQFLEETSFYIYN